MSEMGDRFQPDHGLVTSVAPKAAEQTGVDVILLAAIQIAG